jgi:hypothetical protein
MTVTKGPTIVAQWSVLFLLFGTIPGGAAVELTIPKSPKPAEVGATACVEEE